MYAFQYHRAASIADAVSTLKSGEARLLAGGQTLLPAMKLRLSSAETLIDLSAVDELRGIAIDADNIVVGAMNTHAEVAACAGIAERIPALSALAGSIGDPQVRNQGTIGGSIANNDPTADYPAALLGLSATVITNEREISADDFFVDIFETALGENEIVTAVSFPVPQKAGYAKLPNPASRYAIVGVMAAMYDTGARVAVTGAGPCVFRVTEMEHALTTNFSPAALQGIHVAGDGLNEDIHAGAAYRAHLVNVMARRAVTTANE